jgi:hypothetical protein
MLRIALKGAPKRHLPPERYATLPQILFEIIYIIILTK